MLTKWLNLIVKLYGLTGMKDEREKQHEEIILEAATKVFSRRGFFGARMQDIADEAGINKAMLHYYYRSKDKIFEDVFQIAFKSLFEKVSGVLQSELEFDKKICKFCEKYIDTLIEFPAIPAFVIHELNHNPERLKSVFKHIKKLHISNFFKQIQSEIEKQNIIYIDPRQFMINMIALCIFPFVAKPIIMANFDFDEEGYKDFIIERKKIVPQFILNSIKRQDSDEVT